MNQTTVLITGALTGIGRATAFAFARLGTNVVISGRRDETGLALAAELRTLGAKAEYVKADVANESEVRSLVEKTVNLFGKIDIAVNNAGTEGTLGPITEQSVDNFHATFTTNVLGTLLSIKHEMRAMLAQGHGSIVNLSSIAGQLGMAGASVYAARKDAEQKLALWKQSPDKAQLPPSVQMSRKLVFAQPPQVMDAALRIPEKQLPAWTMVDLGADGVAVLRVNKVLPIQITDQEINETEAQFGSYWGKAEADAYYRALKRQYKVEFVNEGKKVMDKAAEPQKTASSS